jgi:hypothetical protein
MARLFQLEAKEGGRGGRGVPHKEGGQQTLPRRQRRAKQLLEEAGGGKEEEGEGLGMQKQHHPEMPLSRQSLVLPPPRQHPLLLLLLLLLPPRKLTWEEGQGSGQPPRACRSHLCPNTRPGPRMRTRSCRGISMTLMRGRCRHPASHKTPVPAPLLSPPLLLSSPSRSCAHASSIDTHPYLGTAHPPRRPAADARR